MASTLVLSGCHLGCLAVHLSCPKPRPEEVHPDSHADTPGRDRQEADREQPSASGGRTTADAYGSESVSTDHKVGRDTADRPRAVGQRPLTLDDWREQSRGVVMSVPAPR